MTGLRSGLAARWKNMSCSSCMSGVARSRLLNMLSSSIERFIAFLRNTMFLLFCPGLTFAKASDSCHQL